MDTTALALDIVAWLASYAVHSTLLLVAAFAGSRLIRRPGLEELVWKSALLGGVVTATFATFSPGDPLAGRITLAARAATPPPAVTPSRPLVATTAAIQAAPAVPGWLATVVLAVLTGATTSFALLLLSLQRLRLRIAGRRPVEDPRLRRVARRLARRQGRRVPLRLSASDAIDIPMALPGAEVCLPVALGDVMDGDAQEAALAHEIAHVVRRDPAWLLGLRAVEAAFFFQPLNRLARRRWQECSELLCDDWAAARTGAPLQMAQSLTAAAAFVVSNDDPVPAMARCRSTLVRRVTRLVDPGWAPSAPASRREATIAALLVMAVACAAPAVAPPPAPETKIAENVSRETGTPSAAAAVSEPPIADDPELAPLPTWTEQVRPAGASHDGALATPPDVPALPALPELPDTPFPPGVPFGAEMAFPVEMPVLPEMLAIPEMALFAKIAENADGVDPAVLAELAGGVEHEAMAREELEQAIAEHRRSWEKQRRAAELDMARARRELDARRDELSVEARIAVERARMAKERAEIAREREEIRRQREDLRKTAGELRRAIAELEEIAK